jgi:hypothetical protein
LGGIGVSVTLLQLHQDWGSSLVHTWPWWNFSYSLGLLGHHVNIGRGEKVLLSAKWGWKFRLLIRSCCNRKEGVIMVGMKDAAPDMTFSTTSHHWGQVTSLQPGEVWCLGSLLSLSSWGRAKVTAFSGAFGWNRTILAWNFSLIKLPFSCSLA